MIIPRIRIRQISHWLAVLALALGASLMASAPAQAAVQVSFHSFNGSVLWGRYPHTFVVFQGVLDDTGQRINENFGFSAKYTSQAITSGPAEHEIIVEEQRTIPDTNRHFTITVSDTKYREMRAEVERWRNHPGRYYDLDERNCIHFVARMAELVGLQVDVPEDFLRRPKAWLNYITRNNPQLRAREID